MTVAEIIVNYLRTLKVHEPVQKKRTQTTHVRGNPLRVHNVRVDDALWAMVGEVGKRNGMTRTDVIVDYLRTLTVPPGQRSGTSGTLSPKIRTDVRVAVRGRPNPPARVLDDTPCKHPTKKTVANLGTFCGDCGKPVEP